MPKYISQEGAGRTLATVHQQLTEREAARLAQSLPRLPNQLGLCLDVSGSMTPLVSTVVAGYNQFLTAMPDAQVTRVMFGGHVSVPVRQRLAAELLPMTEGEYELQGSTALLDGFGAIIHEVGAVYDPPSKLNKPSVLIALLTDGFENASHRYTLEDIRQTVAYRRITCGWQFIYLTSSDRSYGLRLGIQPSNIAEFSNDPADLASLLERVRSAANAFYLGDRNFARFLLKEKN